MTRKLRKLSAVNKYVTPEKLSPSALLQRSNPLQQIELFPDGIGKSNLKKLRKLQLMNE